MNSKLLKLSYHLDKTWWYVCAGCAFSLLAITGIIIMKFVFNRWNDPINIVLQTVLYCLTIWNIKGLVVGLVEAMGRCVQYEIFLHHLSVNELLTCATDEAREYGKYLVEGRIRFDRPLVTDEDAKMNLARLGFLSAKTAMEPGNAQAAAI